MKNLSSILLAAAIGSLFSTSSAQAAGCETVESGRFQYVLYECGEKVSAGDMKKSERFLAETEATLGTTVTRTIEYHKVALPEQIDALTGIYGIGVTLPKSGRIYSTRTFHSHELVHRVAIELGDPGRFFHEGLAVALAPESGWQGRDLERRAKAALRRAPISAYVQSFERQEQNAAYAVAGAFVSHLVKTHGVAKVAEMFRRAGQSRRADGAFIGVFGTTLETATAAWAQSI